MKDLDNKWSWLTKGLEFEKGFGFEKGVGFEKGRALPRPRLGSARLGSARLGSTRPCNHPRKPLVSDGS